MRRVLCGSAAYLFGTIGAAAHAFPAFQPTPLGLVNAAVVCAAIGWLGMRTLIWVAAGPVTRLAKSRLVDELATPPTPVDDWMTMAHAAGVARGAR